MLRIKTASPSAPTANAMSEAAIMLGYLNQDGTAHCQGAVGRTRALPARSARVAASATVAFAGSSTDSKSVIAMVPSNPSGDSVVVVKTLVEPKVSAAGPLAIVAGAIG